MSFREFVEESRELVSQALVALGYPFPENLEWDEPPSESLGDISFRVGYQLSKSLRKKPADIAGELANSIQSSSTPRKFVASAEAHPSGFLNFRLNHANLFQALLIESKKDDYGRIDLGQGKHVLVEHTAVNPNKALHIGHLRNVALGDSISRIYAFTKHNVSVLNYIDDSGLQVADIIVGFMFLNYSKDAPAGIKYDHYTGDTVYVNVTRQYDSSPELKAKQKYVLKAIEEHDPSVYPLAKEITDLVLREQLKTCWRFGAFYDLLVYESDIIASGLWHGLFATLKENKITKLVPQGKFEGCWIVSVEGEKEGEDKVLVRSDGTATYIAKDTPFAALKMGLMPDKFTYKEYLTQPNGLKLWRTNVGTDGQTSSPVSWGSDISINVIDIRQGRLQRIIQYILEQLAGKSLKDRYIHLGYSIVSLSPRTASKLTTVQLVEDKEVVTISGRKGTYINADDVFDLLRQKALEETKKRNPDVSDFAWLENVSERIAISAVRFSLLKQDLDKMIVFDLDESLQLIGETGPYMLYTFARASSILSKVSETEVKGEQGLHAKHLSSDSEVALLKLLSKFDIYVEKSVKMHAPKWIAHYSFELCEAFNKFYERHRVLQEADPEVRRARLHLVECFRSVLKKSLGLLGIEPLTKI